MILYHVTPLAHTPSIDAQGLRAACDRSGNGRVWMCSQGRVLWGVLHVMRRHGVHADAVAVYMVRGQRRTARKSGRRGLWYVAGDVARANLTDITADVREYVAGKNPAGFCPA